jgi:hypothetical protein
VSARGHFGKPFLFNDLAFFINPNERIASAVRSRVAGRSSENPHQIQDDDDDDGYPEEVGEYAFHGGLL